MKIPKSISKNVFVPALRKYLEGTISPKEMRWWMIGQLDDVEKDIDAGEDTELLTISLWRW